MADNKKMAHALSMDDRMRTFGMDPEARRLSFLPYPRGGLRGDTGAVDWSDWTAPQFVYDAVRAATLPGHAAQGGEFAPRDVTDMALVLAGRAPAAGAGSRSVLGMNAGRPKGMKRIKRRPKTREEVEIQGGPLTTKPNTVGITRILEDHAYQNKDPMRMSPAERNGQFFYENVDGKIVAEEWSKGSRLERKTFDDASSLRTIRNWLGY